MRSQDELTTLVSAISDGIVDLSQRFARMEGQVDSSNIRRQSMAWSQSHEMDGSMSDVTVDSLSQQASEKSSVATLRQSEFEKDLKASRPYRKATRDTVDYSFRSSIALSHAWSALSDLSLSDISVMSVIALPVLPSEICNWYYYKGHEVSTNIPTQNQGPPTLDVVREEISPTTPVSNTSTTYFSHSERGLVTRRTAEVHGDV
jgi:hypothetical protein